MDTTAAKLTVFFEEPFWVGVYERTESGQVDACRVVFGAEPKDYEVYDFLLKHWDSMRFSPPVAAEGIPSQIRNPKRARRAAKQARQNVEPFSCERPGRVWTLITFIGALAIIAGVLITGAWSNE